MDYIDADFIEADSIVHYGVSVKDGAPGVGSGRYPLGSGEKPYQHASDFLGRIEELKKNGLSEKEIAEYMGLKNTSQLRVQKSIANGERRSALVARAKELREQGLSLDQIAKEMGYNNDSSIRSLLNEDSERRMNQARVTADILKRHVDEKGMIDVGTGVERELGVSKEMMKEALYLLELEGYNTFGGRVAQATNPGKMTTISVLCPPGTEHKDIYNFDQIHSLDPDVESHDGGATFDPKWVYPKSMDSKRLQIRYAEEGGIDKDGVIELRRGVDDLSLGDAHYAQVRILVDGTHYLKGMALYSDNMPDGVDVVFNTNKTQGTPMMKVLKEIKKDPDNPFGALLKEGINDPTNPISDKKGGQSYYIDKDGKKQLSLINKNREEGDWGEWSKELSAQFLSKQPRALMQKQLGLTIADRQAEYDEICSLTNPTVKKRLLDSFADDCDAAAVHLKAAALPRQKYQVLIPVASLKDNEVYAPGFRQGEQVALIRYPHGGTFEIPILTVNNKHTEGKRVLGNALDAVGINKNNADRLSGADFDGDTVLVIPTGGKVKITSTPQLVKDFEPKIEYGGKKEGTFKVMNNTQTEMGKISNLITDMTLKGATREELARAVRHSMVVIDAEKHKLDYKQSEKDHGIAELKKIYQHRVDDDGSEHNGASTLISRAKGETTVLKRRGQPWVNKDTGELEWERTNPKTGEHESKIVRETYTATTKTGKVKEKVRTQKSTQMAETKDAFTLVSEARSPAEVVYATYANKMKAMANQARKESLSTSEIKYSPSAKKVYEKEVDSLDIALRLAQKNAPKERRAQMLASSALKAKEKANPDISNKEKKKIAQQELTKARTLVGAKRQTIKISDREWEAIQAGAISPSKLKQILNHTDTDEIKKRAMPRTQSTLSDAKIAKLKAMSSSGYTLAEIADSIGISTSTVSKYLK